MINLTQSQFNLFKANCHLTKLQDIKSVLKCLRFDGLTTPKLNSKKVVLIDFWNTLTMSAIDFASIHTPKAQLFNNQLTNVGVKSCVSLAAKLAH